MEKNKMSEVINNFIKGSDKNKSLLILLLIIGLCLILFSSLFSSSDKEESTNETKQMTSSEYKAELEKSIEDTLSKVNGVGSVKVTITLDGEIKKNIAYNENSSASTSGSDKENVSDSTSSSKDAVMVRNGSNESPFTTKDEYPDVIGVVVVASGAESKTVQYYITKSVEALLGLPSYKVVVLPSKENI